MLFQMNMMVKQSDIEYSLCRLPREFIYQNDFFTHCYGEAIEPACPRKYLYCFSVCLFYNVTVKFVS